MSRERARVKELIVETKAECEQIARTLTSNERALPPSIAIRRFYSSIQPRKSTVAPSYMNRMPPSRSMTLLQELLLGDPVIVDLSGDTSVRREFGLSVEEMVAEIAAGRIIPAINCHPFDLSTDYLSEIYPLLRRPRDGREWPVLLRHFRTRAFVAWYCGRSTNAFEERGMDLWRRHFEAASGPEQEAIVETLRTQRYGARAWEAARKAFQGRWRNLSALDPELAEKTENALRRMENSSRKERAAVFDGVKESAVSPVTAAIGGGFRCTRRDLRNVVRAARLDEFRELFGASSQIDPWGSEIVQQLVHAGAMPSLTTLNYAMYRRILDDRKWHDVQKTLRKLRGNLQCAPGAKSGRNAICDAVHVWNECVREAESCLNSYGRAKVWFRIQSWTSILLPRKAGFVATRLFPWLAWRAEEAFVDSTRFGSPGRQLALAIWKGTELKPWRRR